MPAKDIFCTLAVFVTCLWYFDPFSTRIAGPIIYVSPQGSDCYLGWSASYPVRTLSRALRISEPGDTIKLLPGTYFGRLHIVRGGTKQSPLSIEAVTPGTVTITGKSRHTPFKAGWTHCGNGIYGTRPKWPIHCLRAGHIHFFRVPWGGLNALRQHVQLPNAYPAFTYANGELFVWVPPEKRELLMHLDTHYKLPQAREWGEFAASNIACSASHLRFNGLTFDFGIGSGLHLWDAIDVHVSDCAFRSCKAGIKATHYFSPPSNLVVEHCVYDNYPQYHWQHKWLSWSQVYSSYSSSGLISSKAPRASIRNNLVIHAADALQVTSPSVRSDSAQGQIVIEGNFLALATDDAIEFDGPSRDVLFRRNVVTDCLVSLGTSPVAVGPTVIEENLFLHRPEGLNGSQLKLLTPRSERSRDDAIRNVHVRNNLFVGKTLYWWRDVTLDNIHVVRNVFHLVDSSRTVFPDAVHARENVVGTPELDSQQFTTIVRRFANQTGAQRRDMAWISVPFLKARPGPHWMNWDRWPGIADISPEVLDISIGFSPNDSISHKAESPFNARLRVSKPGIISSPD